MKLKTISELNTTGLRKEAKNTIMWLFNTCMLYRPLLIINTVNEKLCYLECILDDNNKTVGFVNYSVFPQSAESDACLTVLNIGFVQDITDEQRIRVINNTLQYLKIFALPIVYVGKNEIDSILIAQTGLVDAIIPLTELEER